MVVKAVVIARKPMKGTVLENAFYLCAKPWALLGFALRTRPIA